MTTASPQAITPISELFPELTNAKPYTEAPKQTGSITRHVKETWRTRKRQESLIFDQTMSNILVLTYLLFFHICYYYHSINKIVTLIFNDSLETQLESTYNNNA